jgi:hypothetical protein
MTWPQGKLALVTTTSRGSPSGLTTNSRESKPSDSRPPARRSDTSRPNREPGLPPRTRITDVVEPGFRARTDVNEVWCYRRSLRRDRCGSIGKLFQFLQAVPGQLSALSYPQMASETRFASCLSEARRWRAWRLEHRHRVAQRPPPLGRLPGFTLQTVSTFVTSGTWVGRACLAGRGGGFRQKRSEAARRTAASGGSRGSTGSSRAGAASGGARAHGRGRARTSRARTRRRSWARTARGRGRPRHRT